EEVITKLEKNNFLNFFPIIVAGDDVKRSKPWPDTYLLAVEKLGLKPSECLAFEDTQYGLQSAKNAGVYCFAIPNEYSVRQDFSRSAKVLTSFKDQLDSFGKRVNEIYNEETKQRSSLLTEIKNLKDLNNQIASDAVNLTKALKGQNKTQGDWGEMILSSILDQTGLREGKEYTIQGSFNDSEGKRLRPDVIVHLPSKKDIVIDSKVSLNSYVTYCKTENETHKEAAAKELLKSITTHIKALSAKRYEEIDGVRTLDFVLMFIPVEGAFVLATSNDDSLFKMAFEHNIMLVSPSTLYVTLRTIENIWRNEHQNENAQLISKKAADLYDKFASFVSDIEDIGVNINRTQKSYDSAMNKLSLGNANLIKRAEEFIELGVKPKKQLSSKLLTQDEE
ncbi:MAG: DNA recombination protein RmuC, partial [Erysipelotrichia bacterium]|nr:DNA recombination protein RmuC [Erysipelotrichia bacterium]